MRLLRLAGALGLTFGLLVAAKDEPKVKSNKFDFPQTRLFFFDDSERVLVIDHEKHSLRISDDAGANWDIVEDVPEGKIHDVQGNIYDNQVAIAQGDGKQHWITYDQGKSWRSFKVPAGPSITQSTFTFHATDSKRILFNSEEECYGMGSCYGTTYYTTDGFKNTEILHEDRVNCLWAKSEPLFTTGDKDDDLDSAICIVKGKTPYNKDAKLVTSTNFFKKEREVVMSSGRTITGMINVASVKGYVVAAAKAENSKEMALYVTTDMKMWHFAQFGTQRIEQDAYTVLESTNYSIQIDVQTDRWGALGDLYSSNSNGTYFTKNIEHVNRNDDGYVDFERVNNIQGIILVNQIQNWEDVNTGLGSILSNRKVKSKISFDDGRTWQGLKADKNKEFHVHSVTDQRNSGRIFSSPAPGILMANGNFGEYLQTDYKKAQLFVSDDAGLTWRSTGLEGPQKYEFGDSGSVLLAVPDPKASEFSYSLNHGKDWKTIDLPEKNLAISEVTTIPDSTSLKFVVEAQTEDKGFRLISIDFSALKERDCKEDDFEKWYARLDEEGEPGCIMGHKQWFRRRKADADCFVNKEFRDPVPESEPCDCTKADFECDYNFVPDGKGNCKLAPGKKVYPGNDECENPEDTFMGSSGYRLHPGNDCKREKGEQKDDKVEYKCSETKAAPTDGKVKIEITPLRGKKIEDYYYFERNEASQDEDETIVVLTDAAQAFITHDHGKEWKQIKAEEDIIGIYNHNYNNDYIYLLTPTGKVYYSEDRGYTIHYFDAPKPPSLSAEVMSFHPVNYDWMIWTGAVDCDRGRSSPDCHNVAYISKKNGDKFEELLGYSEKCQFMYREDLEGTEDLIYCERHESENPNKPKQLLSSTDLFEHKNVLFNNVVSYASMSEFIIVASKDGEGLRAQASIDGERFAHAQWPPKFEVTHETAYTVLDSSTHSIYLHVTTQSKEGAEYGSILKSNSNGTNYVLSLNYVHRNEEGYVDFEKMRGIEGVALVNSVYNHEAADDGAVKQLKSLITHDDAADWAYIPPPRTDIDGKPLCDGEIIEKCSLHLHGFTERDRTIRDGYSSPSAVGLMIATGNVGEFLTKKSEADTYMTRDAGITWSQIQKGAYMWEYGDQGSIIVLVEKDKSISDVKYSTDDGKTWTTLELGQTFTIERITTVPSDNSRNFLLWGKQDGKVTTVNLDFSDIFDRLCKLDKENPESKDSDYDLWSPTHPLKDGDPDCLFGHVSRYYRRKPDAQCFNGPMIDKLHDIARNCSCTRQDFECDFNFERQTDGSCALIYGLEPLNPLEMCAKNPDQYLYYEPTGYRKIPISTCKNGRELEYAAGSKPCPGHEEEYQRKTGISGAGLFFAITVPIALAAAFGYYVYRNWDGKFGQIRLGDSGGFGARDGSNPLIQYPIIALAGVVAVAANLPLLLASLWRTVRGACPGGGRGSYDRVYNTRSSFARGGQDYSSSPVADEGELLGDESDEELGV